MAHELAPCISQRMRDEHGITDAEIAATLMRRRTEIAAIRARWQPIWDRHVCAVCRDGSPKQCVNNPGLWFGSVPVRLSDVLADRA